MRPIDHLFSSRSCEVKAEPVLSQPNQSPNAYLPASASASKRDKNILLAEDPLSTLKPNLVITILGNGHRSIEGELSHVSADGLCFLSPEAIPSGTAIRIDRPDGLVLGEALHSAPTSDCKFSVGILFHEVLDNLHSLEPLFRNLQPRKLEADSKSNFR